MRPGKILTGLALVTVAATTATVNALPALAEEPPSAKPTGNPTALAQHAADKFVAGAGAAVIFKGPGDKLVRKATYTGGNGLRYVTYDRTFHGLPVAGGDTVVLTDAKGAVKAATTGQKTTIDVPTKASISSAKALAAAKARLKRADDSTAPKLVVDAYGKTPRLAWETRVAGLNARHGASKLHVLVDAKTGKVLHSVDEVRDEGVGNGYHSGKVSLSTTKSGSSYVMKDPKRPGLECAKEGASPYTNSTDVWGNGSGSDLVTACVDAMYGAAKQLDMLRTWMGRDGIDGNGNAFPLQVGWDAANAQWLGTSARFGHNGYGTRQNVPMDVVAHELGHGIFQYTPGGAGWDNENGGLNEGAADIWGTLTEWYANNPYDKPDYDHAEMTSYWDNGPTRNMYDPSLNGDPNCYSSEIPNTEVHAAAGPLTHWFYLVAEGNNPQNGNPVSPTCNGQSVSGLDLPTAGRILYNAELLKTSTWDYAQARWATLTAAKNLYPNSCVEFDNVRYAWDAVSVPAQPNEPTCAAPADDFDVWVDRDTARVGAGASTTSSVHVSWQSGAWQDVQLSAEGLPAGATAEFSRPSINATGVSTMKITTSTSTPPGTYAVAVTGTGSPAKHVVYQLLTVADRKCSGTNDTDIDIAETRTATSSITLSGCDVRPSSAANIEVHVSHPYRGDVMIDLVAPDGTKYPLKGLLAWDRLDDVNEIYTADVSSETVNGTWQLRVEDHAHPNRGHIDSWTLTP